MKTKKRCKDTFFFNKMGSMGVYHCTFIRVVVFDYATVIFFETNEEMTCKNERRRLGDVQNTFRRRLEYFPATEVKAGKPNLFICAILFRWKACISIPAA